MLNPGVPASLLASDLKPNTAYMPSPGPLRSVGVQFGCRRGDETLSRTPSFSLDVEVGTAA
jgi:hypothetical protein